MNNAEPWNAGLSRIRGTKPAMKRSPAATEQSCMSLQRFGMINSKSATAGSKWLKSVMFAQRVGLVLMFVKLIAGSCLRAYVPAPSAPPEATAPVKQPLGTFSAKTRHVWPLASSSSARFGAARSWFSLSAIPLVDPPKRAM